jgi:hypothetical protein
MQWHSQSLAIFLLSQARRSPHFDIQPELVTVAETCPQEFKNDFEAADFLIELPPFFPGWQDVAQKLRVQPCQEGFNEHRLSQEPNQTLRHGHTSRRVFELGCLTTLRMRFARVNGNRDFRESMARIF